MRAGKGASGEDPAEGGAPGTSKRSRMRHPSGRPTGKAAPAAEEWAILAALRRLAGTVANETSDPLTILSTRIDLILATAKGQVAPGSLLDDLSVLKKNVERVIRLVQALRTFAHQGTEAWGPLDLNAVVETALESWESSQSVRQIRLRKELVFGLPQLRGSRGALEQVVLSLFTNAREAMPDGGELRIETGFVPGPQPRLRLVIADTGVGIARGDLRRIFEPFRSTKPWASGLGLFLAHSIIQDHEGTVEVQSTPGAGSTFILTFPVPRGKGS